MCSLSAQQLMIQVQRPSPNNRKTHFKRGAAAKGKKKSALRIV
jgi:hypothetical protein